LLLLARTVAAPNALPPIPPITAIVAQAQRNLPFSVDERYGAKLPCALLVEGSCSVYRERPTVCRQVTSTDLAGCIDEYEGRDRGGGIVGSRYYHDHARNARVPLLAALAARGLPQATFELSAGLLRALEPDAEAQWLAGADPFEGLTPAPHDDRRIQALVASIAADLNLN
jgi:hypothetical protein